MITSKFYNSKMIRRTDPVITCPCDSREYFRTKSRGRLRYMPNR